MLTPAAAFVGDGDLAGFAERHRPIAVAGPAVGAVADHERLDLGFDAVADREEVAHGRVHAGRVAAIVIDAQAQQPRPAVFVVGDGHPDVVDHAGPLQIGQHGGLARNGPLAVVVRVPVGVVGGGPVRGEVLRLSQPERIRNPRHGWLNTAGEDKTTDRSYRQRQNDVVIHDGSTKITFPALHGATLIRSRTSLEQA